MTFVIGIAGGTGSGKTTIARALAAALAPEHVATLEHDWYYRDRSDLSFDEKSQLNFDHPDSLETSLLIEHVRGLKSGRAMDVPGYDFKTHARTAETRRVDPKPVLIVEGILVFVEPALRELMNVKIFVDTDADIRLMRRIRRDIEQRGRTFQQVREQYYKTVRPMHLAFVEPSKRWADVLIPEGGNNAVALDLVTSRLREVVAQSTH
ncbi:MAG: uridine kinase [Deltaproteobacteria bacterium]|jgi:uridine kinase|nr:uridine kinase [Deltaproteobacteria bacterium]